MCPRRRDQRRQSLEQISPLHDDMRRPVSPGCLEPIGLPTVRQRFESAERKRRPGDLATEPLESLSIPGRDRDVVMEGHAALADAAGRDYCTELDDPLDLVDGLDPIPEPSPGLARFGTRRDPRANRGRAEHRHQRIVAGNGSALPVDAIPFD
jgi:hypothetical protein